MGVNIGKFQGQTEKLNDNFCEALTPDPTILSNAPLQLYSASFFTRVLEIWYFKL